MSPHPQNQIRARAIHALGAMPTFPAILNRLLASLAKDDVSFAKLADLIEKDAVVAANVLRLVNSAIYGRRGTVNSVRHAVSLLGVNKLRNSVLGLSVASMWNQVRAPRSWSMVRFNLHSAATAILSDLLAQHVPVDYAEGAFVAGLLHDVGRLLIALGNPAEYEQIVEMAGRDGLPISECEERVAGLRHEDLSAEALSLWNLPAQIQAAVRDHHKPMAASDGKFPLSALVRAADQYVNSAGLTILTGVRVPPGDDFIHALGLAPAGRQTVIDEFQAEYEAIAPFFQ